MEGRLLTDNFLFLTICVFVSFVRTLSVYAAQSLLCSTAVLLCSTAMFPCSTTVFLCSTTVFPCSTAVFSCSTAVFHAAQSLIHAAQSLVLAAQPPFHAAEVALTGHRSSLKAKTRSKRGKGIRRRVMPDSKIPGNWAAFLRTDKNKEELFHFFADQLGTVGVQHGQVVSTKGNAVVCNRETDDTSRCHHAVIRKPILGYCYMLLMLQKMASRR